MACGGFHISLWLQPATVDSVKINLETSDKHPVNNLTRYVMLGYGLP